MTEPLAYELRNAASEIGVGRTTLYRLLSEGQIKSISIGRRRLITRAALEAFIASMEADDGGSVLTTGAGQAGDAASTP